MEAAMPKAPRSGLTVRDVDVPIILAMVARGDRRHDVAAWFGLNQGRIKEVEDGAYGNHSVARGADLPPSGSPGPKARTLRRAIEETRRLLQRDDIAAARERLDRAAIEFDQNE